MKTLLTLILSGALFKSAEVKGGVEKLPPQFEIWKSISNLNQTILQIENMKRG